MGSDRHDPHASNYFLLPALYFDKLSGRKRREYFAAVQAGLDRNYEPMTKLFTAVIERTLQIHGA